MKRFLTAGVACLALAIAAQAQDAPADALQPPPPTSAGDTVVPFLEVRIPR